MKFEWKWRATDSNNDDDYYYFNYCCHKTALATQLKAPNNN